MVFLGSELFWWQYPPTKNACARVWSPRGPSQGPRR
jgi:hypothetical protein